MHTHRRNTHMHTHRTLRQPHTSLGPVVPPSSCEVSRIHTRRLSLPVSPASPVKNNLRTSLSLWSNPTASTMWWGSWPLHSGSSGEILLWTTLRTPVGGVQSFPGRQSGHIWSLQGDLCNFVYVGGVRPCPDGGAEGGWAGMHWALKEAQRMMGFWSTTAIATLSREAQSHGILGVLWG